MEQNASRLRLYSRCAATFVGVGALLVILGWTFGNSFLKSFSSALVPMNPATAVLFLLTAVCLAVRSIRVKPRRVVLLNLVLGSAILCVSFLTLLEFVSDLQFGIDQILFHESLGPNRMAPNTALYFFLLGVGLLTSGNRWMGDWPSQALTLLVLGGAMVSLLGYVYGAQELYGVGRFIPMALNTALLFTISTTGLLCLQEERGIFSILLGTTSGSIMARQLLPAALIIPCILGLLRIAGQRAGLYDTEFGAALMVVANVVLLVTAIVVTASALNRSDAERGSAMKTLQQTHQDLQRQTEVLQLILNSMGDGVVVADVNGKFTLFNPAAERILGLGPCVVEPEEWTRQYGCFLPDDLSPYPPQQLPLARALRGEVVDEAEMFIRNAGNTQGAWICCSGRPLCEADGQLRGGVVVIRDITEKKQSAEALRRSHDDLERRVSERTKELAAANLDLAQKNQENEMFVYSVSHDLRSPLVNLQGFSKELAVSSGELRNMLAESDLSSDRKEPALRVIDLDMQESIRFIQTAVTRLSGIIDALLRLSRVGRVEYQLQEIDTSRLVANVVESMSGTIFECGATVRVFDLPAAFGDANAVEQIFANLIGNSLKYCDPNRPCEVEVGFDANAVDVPANCAGAYFVRDNGLGIAATYLPKVFQAFKRLHPNVADGEGMGLAIVRRMVERLGGKVWVTSVVGGGSTFFVALPLSPGSRRLDQNASERIQEHENATAGDFACRR